MDIGTLTGQIDIKDNLSERLTFGTEVVSAFAEEFDGMTKIVLGGAGLIVGSFAAITGSIIALGNRGSDINDVASTLEHFAGSAESATATIEEMQKGTKGTVDDFFLAGEAARLMSAKVKLSSDEFGTLSQAAFVLQNRGLGDTKQMMDLVSDALITGRTRTLAMKLGVVEVADAEKDFADKLGTTKEHLSASGIAEARRIGIMKMLKSAVADAGEQERDFGELMEAAIVKIENWGDELASQVAKSPQVMRAVTAIGDAIYDAFGVRAANSIQTIVGWINRFADMVGKYAPIVIRWVGDIIDKVQAFYNRVLDYWDTVPDWFKNIAREAAVTSGVIYVSSQSIKAFAGATESSVGTVASFATIISGARDSVLSLVETQKLWIASGSGVLKWGGEVIGMLKTFGLEAVAFYASETAAATGLTAVGTALAGFGSAVAVFLLSPVGLAIAAVASLVGGLRILTGSWDFILTPMKMAWQGLKDVWTITDEVVDIMREELDPVLDLVAATFTTTANVVRVVFVEALKQARGELLAFWEIAKQAEPLKSALESLQLIHDAAERIRARQPQVASPELPVVPVTTIPGTTVPVGGGAVSGGPSPLKASDDLEQYRKKVEDLQKTLRLAGEETRVFTDVFSKLSSKQLENVAVQQKLIPLIEQTAAAQDGHLAPSMQALYTKFVAQHEAVTASGVALLKTMNVTTSYLDAQKEMGRSETQIAVLLGVSTDALSAYSTELQQLAAHKQAQAGIMQRQLQEEADAFNTGQRAIVDARRQYDDFVKRSSLTTTDYEIAQIDRWVDDQIDAFVGTAEQAEQFTTTILALAAKRKAALLVDNQALVDNSQHAFDQIAEKAYNTWQAMERDPEHYGRTTRAHFQNVAKDAARAAAGIAEWGSKLKAVMSAIDMVAGGLAHISQVAGGTAGAVVGHMATIVQAIGAGLSAFQKHQEEIRKRVGEDVADTVKDFGVATALVDENATKVEKWGSAVASAMAIASGAASVWAATSHKATASAGALAGAASGAAAGAAFGPYGVAIGAVVGALVGWIRNHHAGRKALEEFADSLDTVATGTGFDELHQKLLLLGDEGEAMWVDLTQGAAHGNATLMKQKIDEIKAALAGLDADIAKYDLHWYNLANSQSAGTKAAEDLVKTYNRLISAGYKVDDVTTAMSKDLSQYIVDSIRAGTKIPPQMQQIINKVIQLGGLTLEAQNALAGLAASGVPSLQDITEAADRYGIKLDELGPKVKQLQITELANQYVADWKTLTAATDDWGVLFDKMGPKVQDLVLDAIKYGTELPASMKPMIQAFIDAGRLVDENGDKLTELTQLNWAVDLEEMVATLVSTMQDLANAIRDGVGGALTEIGKTKIPPIEIPVHYNYSTGGQEAMEDANFTTPLYAAQGLTVPPIFSAGPKGSDTVPAYLTPGERVLTVAEARQQDEKDTGGGTAILNMDGRLFAKMQIPKFRKQVKVYGLSKR